MDIAQIGAFAFGVASIWMVAQKKDWRKWGYLVGLASQPFWFWLTIQEELWLIFGLACLYTVSWMQGIWNYLIPYSLKRKLGK